MWSDCKHCTLETCGQQNRSRQTRACLKGTRTTTTTCTWCLCRLPRDNTAAGMMMIIIITIMHQIHHRLHLGAHAWRVWTSQSVRPSIHAVRALRGHARHYLKRHSDKNTKTNKSWVNNEPHHDPSQLLEPYLGGAKRHALRPHPPHRAPWICCWTTHCPSAGSRSRCRCTPLPTPLRRALGQASAPQQ